MPRVTVKTEPTRAQFGVGGTSAPIDEAMRPFVEVLPSLAEWAELENAVLRLTRERRKTQRRGNALSKIFIPDHRETTGYIVGASRSSFSG